MLSFKKFLKEGGNLPFVDPTKPHEGERISDSINTAHRDTHKGHFLDMFHSINNGFNQQHGHSLFGNALKNNTFASGSSEVYNDPSVSTERFKKIKPTMGDYDVQIPIEHKQKLEDYLQPGQTHGAFTVAHVSKGKNQVHAIVRHNDTGQRHQIDFEPIDYDEQTQEPKPFEKFAHNSHIDDLEQGLKGVHHKLLVQSVYSAHSTPSLISKTTGRGKAKTETQEEGNVAPYTFSVDNGVRQKWKQVGENNGKPVVQEQPSKGAEYTKDMPTIYRTMFNKDPSEQDLKDIHSFGGVINHIKQHIPKEHHGKIFNTFVQKLWGKGSQATGLTREADRKIKESAYNALANHFPEHHLENQQNIEQMKGEYYSPESKMFARGEKFSKPSKDSSTNHPVSESDEEHHHVVFAAGRFTGPTEEHHKLLNKVFNTKAHSHRVYVMGPTTKEETSDKDPLTVDEKLEHLKRLYPEHADSFIGGNERHTKNPQKALVHTWHSVKKPGRKVNISVVAGSGDEGVKNKSSAGGSLESYKKLIDRYNGTRFPESTDEEGNKRGGDLRMDYNETNYIENPRGKTSGSVMRKMARESDHTNPEHVKNFKKLLHPGFSDEHAAHLMKTIKERSKKISESLFQRVKRIIL